MIFSTSYLALSDNTVVREPAPATIGKARGIIEADSGVVPLYKVIPKIISKAKKNRMKDPATAKASTVTPNRFSNCLPINKKSTNKTPATIAVFSDCMRPAFLRRLMIIGTLPIISITANSTIVAETISTMSKCRFIKK